MGMAASLLALPARAADDEDEGSISWQHDWVPTRMFSYAHKAWGNKIKEGDFGAFFVKNDLTIRHGADGTTVRRWEFEFKVQEPGGAGRAFHVASKSSLTKTAFREFDVTWSSGGVSRSFSEDDVLEWSYDAGSIYIGDNTGQWLQLDGSKRGVLRGVIETIDQPNPGFESLIADSELLQTGVPSKSRTISVEVPVGTPLRFDTRFFTMPSPTTPETDRGFDRYTFAFEKLWGMWGERSMPHIFDSYPSLWWSNQDSWEAFSAHADGLWEPELVANEPMRAWAGELTEGLTGTRERALAIHDAIADGWDYLGFYPGESGWIPHPATQCYAARIGDCKDKTALMITLMRAVGLSAHPALINASSSFEVSPVPVPFFNHAIVWVEDADAPDGGFFLDSVDAGIGAYPVRASLADRDALVVDASKGRLVRVPLTPAERWLEEDVMDIELATDGSATATVIRRYVGMSANGIAGTIAGASAEQVNRGLRAQLLYALPGASITAMEHGPDPSDPDDIYSVRATLQLDSLLSMQGDHAVFTPPWIWSWNTRSVEVDSSTRRHPEVLSPSNRRGVVRLHLPDGLSVLALPSDGGEERGTMRLAIRTTRAVLQDVGGEQSLFSEHERPNCRVPSGLRIEVETPSGETLVTTMDDLVRLPVDPFAEWKGPRKGVAAGALVHESYHIDYSLGCAGGMMGVERDVGGTVPVLSEIVIVECEDCAVDVGGPGELAFVEEDGRRVLRASNLAPESEEARAPSQEHSRWYVSTSTDPLAWGKLLVEQLPAQSRAWAREAGAWGKWARDKGAGLSDKTVALAYGLGQVRVFENSHVWKYGAHWGEPASPGERTLQPLEWWAMAHQVLKGKGIPVLYTDEEIEIVGGAASIHDWDEYGFLLPGVGLLTTYGWEPLAGEGNDVLAGRSIMILDDNPRIEMLRGNAGTRSAHWAVGNEPSGVSSVLVTVDRTDNASRGVRDAQIWERRLHRMKKNKEDQGEVVRKWAAERWFGGRRITVTTITTEDGSIRVQTGWTRKNAMVRGEGYTLMPVFTVGLPTFLRGLGDERSAPIVLGAQSLSGEVRVQTPSGLTLGGLPANELVSEGPLRFEANWSLEGNTPVLRWALQFDEDVVPASAGPTVSAIGAAIDRVASTQLVLE